MDTKWRIENENCTGILLLYTTIRIYISSLRSHGMPRGMLYVCVCLCLFAKNSHVVAIWCLDSNIIDWFSTWENQVNESVSSVLCVCARLSATCACRHEQTICRIIGFLVIFLRATPKCIAEFAWKSLHQYIPFSILAECTVYNTLISQRKCSAAHSHPALC